MCSICSCRLIYCFRSWSSEPTCTLCPPAPSLGLHALSCFGCCAAFNARPASQQLSPPGSAQRRRPIYFVFCPPSDWYVLRTRMWLRSIRLHLRRLSTCCLTSVTVRHSMRVLLLIHSCFFALLLICCVRSLLFDRSVRCAQVCFHRIPTSLAASLIVRHLLPMLFSRGPATFSASVLFVIRPYSSRVDAFPFGLLFYLPVYCPLCCTSLVHSRFTRVAAFHLSAFLLYYA